MPGLLRAGPIERQDRFQHGRLAEVGDEGLQVAQAGGINAGRLPTGEGFGQKGE